jgi:hypothetical protein
MGSVGRAMNMNHASMNQEPSLELNLEQLLQKAEVVKRMWAKLCGFCLLPDETWVMTWAKYSDAEILQAFTRAAKKHKQGMPVEETHRYVTGALRNIHRDGFSFAGRTR